MGTAAAYQSGYRDREIKPECFYIRFSHHQTVESGLYDRIIEAKGTDSVGGEFFARRDGGSHETLTDYRRDAYRPDI